MKWIDITAFNTETKEDDVIAKCILHDDETVSFEGDETIFPESIMIPGGDHEITAADGLAYLLALQEEFKSYGAMASDLRTS